MPEGTGGSDWNDRSQISVPPLLLSSLPLLRVIQKAVRLEAGRCTDDRQVAKCSQLVTFICFFTCLQGVVAWKAGVGHSDAVICPLLLTVIALMMVVLASVGALVRRSSQWMRSNFRRQC